MELLLLCLQVFQWNYYALLSQEMGGEWEGCSQVLFFKLTVPAFNSLLTFNQKEEKKTQSFLLSFK